MSISRTPHRVGPFDLISPAAEGSSAVVWRAVHRTRRVPVAIKILESRRTDEAQVQRWFAQEVRAVARLDHPGIVRIHDVGTLPALDDRRLPRGASWLAMEWVGGGTLADKVGQLDWPSLRATLLALLDALAHAHARGIVHQDLKAANVLLSARGPILSDFGIAFTADHELARDAHGGLMGTPNSMAPEQILMQRRRIGPWTDLYALGCLAWLLTTGESPYASRDTFEVLERHLTAPVPVLPPRDDRPPGFGAWVAGLLAKEPADRPRFAAHAAAALRALPGPEPAVLIRPRDPASALPLPGTGQSLFALRETDLAGRAGERQRLWALFEAVADAGSARLALLEGPSGVGKPRLALWLLREAHAAGRADGLRATHAEHDGIDPPGDGLTAMFVRHLRCAGLAGEALLARLLDRLGDEDAAWGLAAALSPGERFAMGDRVLQLGSTTELDEVLCHALACLTRDGPRVIVIDEGQWAESALRLVDHLLGHHPELPVLVVASVSLDRVTPPIRARLDALAERPETTRIAVGPLSAEDLTASLQDRLRLDEGLLQRIVQRAGGSPVFAEELVRHWLRTDALVERGDMLRLRASAEDALPDDLVAIWQVRLSEELRPLGARGRRALEAAAIIGGTVQHDVWQRVARVDDATLDAVREHLLDAQLAVPAASGGWSFSHPMLRALLIDGARRESRSAVLHLRCAAALAEHDTDAETIADHLLAGGSLREAVPLFFTAARERLKRRDLRAMRRVLIRLARVLGRLGYRRDDRERIELRVWWGEACQTIDDPRPAWRHIARAVRQAAALGDDRLVGWSLLALGNLRMREQGSLDRWLRPARAAAERAGDAELWWSTSLILAFGLCRDGRLDESEAIFLPLVDQLDAQADDVRRGDLVRLMALVARGRGQFDRARANAQQAARLYARSGSRLKQAHGYNLLGDLARYAGRLDEAAESYREAVRCADLAGNYDGLTDELNLGAVQLERGDYAEARRCLTAVVQRASRVRFWVAATFAQLSLLACEAVDRRWSAWDARWKASAAVREGRLVDIDGARTAELVARLTAEAGEPERAAMAWRLAADQYRRLGQADAAATAERRATALDRTAPPGSLGG